MIHCNLFESAITSLLYQDGDNSDELIKDLIESSYLVTPNGGYRWNDDSKLWEKKTFYELLEVIESDFSKYNEDYLFVMPSQEQIAKILKLLENNEWEKKLNCKRHLYPLKDGKVLHMETLYVRPRERHDFFSFECPVTYNTENYEMVEKSMQQLTNNTKNLMSIMGYFLCGLTTKKCFYAFYGDIQIKNYLSNMLGKIMGDFYCKVATMDEITNFKGKRLIFFSDPSIINESTLDLLYHNSTCKYLIPTNTNPQGQQNISIKLAPRNPGIPDISLDDFFSWCVCGSCFWFQYRKQYIEK